jgi:hypothetical protein
VLRALLWQVQALLSQRPGAPEVAVAAALDHAVGAAHARALLGEMAARGLVTCVHVPRDADLFACVAHAGVDATPGADAQQGIPRWADDAGRHRPRPEAAAGIQQEGVGLGTGDSQRESEPAHGDASAVVPQWQKGELYPAADGLVPAIFAHRHDAAVVPIAAHYFVTPAASVCVDACTAWTR